MVKAFIIVEEGQSLFDISMMLFGHQDGVFLLLNENAGVDLSILYAGQKLWYTPQVIDKAVLELYTKRNYRPATSDDMLDAPIPEPPLSGNSVIVHQYGLADVAVDAPGEITIPPSVIEFENGNPDIQLSPGEHYEVPACPVIENVIIKDSADNEMYNLAPGTEQTLPDISAKNSDDEIIGTDLASHVILVPDIEVTEADGTSHPKPAGQDVVCTFPELSLVNSEDVQLELVTTFPTDGKIVAWDAIAKNTLGATLATIPSGDEALLADTTRTDVDGSTAIVPAGNNTTCQWITLHLNDSAGTLLFNVAAFPGGGNITAPDATVNRDGVFYSAVKSGGTINVISAGVTPSGILYKRPIIGERTSYLTHDIGWHVQNGSLNFSTPANPATIQDLDYSVTDYFYTLKFNNAFGNKYRFTNSAGLPAGDGLANFSSGDYTAGGGTANYVIDHLTGFGYYTPNIGSFATWDLGIADIWSKNAGFNGMTGWLPMYRTQVNGLIKSSAPHYNTANIFKRGLISGFSESQFWLGETFGQSSTNAFMFNDSNNTRTFLKATSTQTFYICRLHY